MKPIKTMSSIALLCISCLSICCKEEKREQSGKILQIDIPLQADETHLPADSLFCGKEILALETTPDNLISKVDKLEMTNDRLYLLDEQQDMIFIFDRKGKYITKIADIGRGPAEYIEISDFHIDNDVLYLCTGGNGGKIICYDLDGKYQKSFRTEYSCNRITTDSNSIYVHHNFSHPNGNNVGVYDKKENKLVKCYKPYPKQQEGIGSSNRCWTSCNNKVYAAFDYEYSIYNPILVKSSPKSISEKIICFLPSIKTIHSSNTRTILTKREEYLNHRSYNFVTPCSSHLKELFLILFIHAITIFVSSTIKPIR